uniref:Putative secreted protein n=1 Tax=Ixodes ricinus TaxID=34613 RepID=A0A6B0V163_IXORI
MSLVLLCCFFFKTIGSLDRSKCLENILESSFGHQFELSSLLVAARSSVCASPVSQEVTQRNEKAANGFIVHPGCPSSRAGSPDTPTLVVARRSELTVGARVQACGSSSPRQCCVGRYGQGSPLPPVLIRTSLVEFSGVRHGPDQPERIYRSCPAPASCSTLFLFLRRLAPARASLGRPLLLPTPHTLE